MVSINNWLNRHNVWYKCIKCLERGALYLLQTAQVPLQSELQDPPADLRHGRDLQQTQRGGTTSSD